MTARINSFNEAPSHEGPVLIESIEREHGGEPYSLSLWMHASGTPRPPPPTTTSSSPSPSAALLAPAVILCHGMGSFHSEWAPIVKGITQSTTARTYIYDRAGVGGSSNVDLSSIPERMAQTSARELRALLIAADVPPPYILVGHSFGGVVIREFLELLHAAAAVASSSSSSSPPVWEIVHGIVFVDHAVSFATLPPTVDNLVGDGDYAEIIRVTVNGAPPRGFDRGQWSTVTVDQERSTPGMLAEEKAARPSWTALKRLDAAQLQERTRTSSQGEGKGKGEEELPLLRDRRVSVIHADSTRDFEAMYAYAVRHGHGSKEDRQALRDTIDAGWRRDDERLQRRLLNLSTASKWVDVPEHGHNVYLVAPEIVIEEVKWVLGL